MAFLDTRELREEMDDLEFQSSDDSLGLDGDEQERLEAIRELLDDIGPDAYDGVTLIPEDEFEDHARELAEEIGAIPEDNGWPVYCIDWKWAASELQTDYSTVTFDGTDYYYRGG